jgi:hypothetical protein
MSINQFVPRHGLPHLFHQPLESLPNTSHDPQYAWLFETKVFFLETAGTKG